MPFNFESYYSCCCRQCNQFPEHVVNISINGVGLFYQDFASAYSMPNDLRENLVQANVLEEFMSIDAAKTTLQKVAPWRFYSFTNGHNLPLLTVEVNRLYGEHAFNKLHGVGCTMIHVPKEAQVTDKMLEIFSQYYKLVIILDPAIPQLFPGPINTWHITCLKTAIQTYSSTKIRASDPFRLKKVEYAGTHDKEYYFLFCT